MYPRRFKYYTRDNEKPSNVFKLKVCDLIFVLNHILNCASPIPSNLYVEALNPIISYLKMGSLGDRFRLGHEGEDIMMG